MSKTRQDAETCRKYNQQRWYRKTIEKPGIGWWIGWCDFFWHGQICGPLYSFLMNTQIVLSLDWWVYHSQWPDLVGWLWDPNSLDVIRMQINWGVMCPCYWGRCCNVRLGISLMNRSIYRKTSQYMFKTYLANRDTLFLKLAWFPPCFCSVQNWRCQEPLQEQLLWPREGAEAEKAERGMLGCPENGWKLWVPASMFGPPFFHCLNWTMYLQLLQHFWLVIFGWFQAVDT